MSLKFGYFQKPSRYIGHEVNAVKKTADLKVALCFPDTYEIGMSHMGLKILYTIINNMKGVSAERVYAPWADREAYLRKENLLLASLESQLPLKDFEIVGFTLQYELSYTNILNMLDLGGIPLRSSHRGEEDPLIIAGGPCAVNPLPLAPFVDAFVIGDGEEVTGEVIRICQDMRPEAGVPGTRERLLKALSSLKGVYVPGVHDVSGQKITRRLISSLESAPFPDRPVVPYTQIVHDRIAIEISRGCGRGCRFCQAGMIYRPARERSPESVLSLARRSLASTGHDEISFTSLSTGDYSQLLPLIGDFNRSCAGSPVSVSLPSLRVGAVSTALLREIKSVRKTGFTIAPEAGTKRLRNVINKDFTHEEYEETLKKLFKEGWKNVKLYFMIGLPTETIADIDGLIDMAVLAWKTGKEITGRPVNINVGISAFIPKPHTPFQWAGQDSLEHLREKQDYLRRAFRKRHINFRGQHVEHSLLEAAFSRSDSRGSLLLEKAWSLGCRFDGWSEHFAFDTWLKAAKETEIDLYEMAGHVYDREERLPWDFIDTGVTKSYLISEFNKSLEGAVTPECREECSRCGLSCKPPVRENDQVEPSADRSSLFATGLNRRDRQSPAVRMRLVFAKEDHLRFLSHQELVTAILRTLRRAGIPMVYTAGFHPHPKVSFGPALPAGVGGLREYCDVYLKSGMHPGDFLDRFNREAPPGLPGQEAFYIPPGEKSLCDAFSKYEYVLVLDREDEEKVTAFLKRKECVVSREKGDVDIRPMVTSARIDGGRLYLSIADTAAAKTRVLEILREILGKSAPDMHAMDIMRAGLYDSSDTEVPGSVASEKLCLERS